MYERWANYYTIRPGVLPALPYLVQIIVGLLAYSQNMQTLYGQGTGRFSPEEISTFRLEVWESVNALIMAWRLRANRPTSQIAVFGFGERMDLLKLMLLYLHLFVQP